MSDFWYIITVRTGRELVLHEIFNKAGFEVYTPFETRFQTQRARQARAERRSPTPYAFPLYGGYLFIGSDQSKSDALMGIGYLIRRRSDAFNIMTYQGEAVSLTGEEMRLWRRQLRAEIGGRKRVVLRGYDPKRDARKNKSRLYGQEEISLPKFELGEKVEFMSGGFQGLGAEITQSGGSVVTVLTQLFGHRREIKVDVKELRRVGCRFDIN